MTEKNLFMAYFSFCNKKIFNFKNELKNKITQAKYYSPKQNA